MLFPSSFIKDFLSLINDRMFWLRKQPIMCPGCRVGRLTLVCGLGDQGVDRDVSAEACLTTECFSG